MHAPPEHAELLVAVADELTRVREGIDHVRSEEHTSELQSH